MPTSWRSVYSSTVKEVGYDKDTGALHVVWQTGRHSVYEDVPPEDFDTVSHGFSVGKAIHQLIKGVYRHHYE